MTCSEFIEDFSRYYDGTESIRFTEAADRHLEDCGSCRRYLEVFDRGRELLRSFPEIEVTEDFHPRLQHRIYHLKDAGGLGRGGALGTGTTATTALAMAVLLVLAAWSPVLLDMRPEVELSPVVASPPSATTPGLRAPAVSLYPVGSADALSRRGSDRWLDADLFGGTSLSDGYRRAGTMLRTGLD